MRMGVTDLQNCNTTVYIGEKETLPMSQINENIPRLEKAWKLLEEGKVFLSRENSLRAVVVGSNQIYRVNIAAQDCQCEDHEFRPDLICKHIRAAEIAYKIRTGEIVVPYEVKNQ